MIHTLYKEMTRPNLRVSLELLQLPHRYGENIFTGLGLNPPPSCCEARVLFLLGAPDNSLLCLKTSWLRHLASVDVCGGGGVIVLQRDLWLHFKSIIPTKYQD